jgi:hypothetical protein
MKKSGSLLRLRGKGALFLATLGLLANVEPADAQYYQAGQIVTNFTLYARKQFTNLGGRTFAPGEPVRLSDLAGYVVFMEFFDPT